MSLPLIRLLARCGTLSAAALAALAVTPGAEAATSTDASACSTPTLSQPFLSANDTNWYTLAPGQTPDNFTGDGWTLTAGARVTSAQLADGQTGSVLDLPGGATAVSPPVCVTSDYPTARLMERDIAGAGGVTVNVSYGENGGWDKLNRPARVAASDDSWTLSQPIAVHPLDVPSWQLARFTFVARGHTSDNQLYDFYVDPRMGS